jgi:hypothetical protein
VERTISLSRTCHRAYQPIVDLLREDTTRVLQGHAQTASEATAKHVVELDTKWAWFDHSETVTARIGDPTEAQGTTEIPLTWVADKHKRLLPNVEGRLIVSPLSSHETEIRYSGHYQPPLGIFGGIHDAVVGHRVVESVLTAVLADIVDHLVENLPADG